MKFKVLDLFSGIGGFSLGLERTGGFETVAFCEVNEFCSKILKKHWPKIQNLGNITQIGIEPMSSAEDSLARILVTQVNAPELPPPVQVFGLGYAVPFAWFDHSTQSWRTWQRCLETGWEQYQETWPRSGMTRNGIAYQLPTLAQSMNGIGYGLLPTPRRSGRRLAWKAFIREDYQGNLEEWLGENGYEGWINPEFVETIMKYPTSWTEI